jgi:cobalamin biosynthesis protein CobT
MRGLVIKVAGYTAKIDVGVTGQGRAREALKQFGWNAVMNGSPEARRQASRRDEEDEWEDEDEREDERSDEDEWEDEDEFADSQSEYEDEDADERPDRRRRQQRSRRPERGDLLLKLLKIRGFTSREIQIIIPKRYNLYHRLYHAKGECKCRENLS